MLLLNNVDSGTLLTSHYCYTGAFGSVCFEALVAKINCLFKYFLTVLANCSINLAISDKDNLSTINRKNNSFLSQDNDGSIGLNLSYDKLHYSINQP